MTAKELAIKALERNGRRNDDGTAAQNDRSITHDARNGSFDPLLGDPCPCGSRDWHQLSGRMLMCDGCGRKVVTAWIQ
jgi:hypothetical protein